MPEFYFFDSHFYWKLHEARANSGKMHNQMIQKIAGNKPAISVGDFNSTEDEQQMVDVLAAFGDAFRLTATPPQGVENTNLGGGNFTGPPVNRIDFILVSPKVKVMSYTSIEDKRSDSDHYPSDHLPVMSRIRVK